MMTLALMVISILRQKQFKFYIFIVGKRSRNYHTVMFWKVHKWLAHFLLLKVHSCTKKHLIDCRNVFSTTEVLLLLLYLNFGKMILHSAHFICFYLRWRTLTVSSFLISATDVICCSKFAVRSMKDFWQFCQRCFFSLFSYLWSSLMGTLLPSIVKQIWNRLGQSSYLFWLNAVIYQKGLCMQGLWLMTALHVICMQGLRIFPAVKRLVE